ncbi:MAG TPA: hypothetical protein PKJ28_03390 [Bacteroidales bacterium]|mgnify:FL=1|nr:hypothetical protein [Bacteroidales bacterium]HPS72912.1 hypothetical protein [Bacteroidales bacterium]
MKNFHLLWILTAFLLWSCAEKDNTQPSEEIKINSLTASENPVKAWDTAVITVEATGDNLQYRWEANHGNFRGGGKQIRYAAGECCVGLNTITCTVSNSSGKVSDTIMIRVTSYFDPKNK